MLPEDITSESEVYVLLGEWISVNDRLPDKLEPVNIVWVNHDPESYYEHIKDRPFNGTAYYWNGRWWWYSVVCEDYLAEYGISLSDQMDEAIEVLFWMPIPKPPTGSEE